MSEVRTRKRSPWILPVVLAVLIVITAGGVGAAVYLGRRHNERPPAATPPPAGAIATTEVNKFCGACHAVPPADTFPRSAWRYEVTQGYQFFRDSSLAMQAPPIEDVIAYFEERAPLELPLLQFPKPAHAYPVGFERLRIPGPEHANPQAVSNVKLVHLFNDKRFDILACDMRQGRVMVMKPYEASPKLEVLAKIPNPAHAEVVDLDGDGIKDIIVANLGSFTPTDARCGSVVWLRGLPDGSFSKPIPLLENVGRVADVQMADFNGDGKNDLIVGVFGLQHAGEIIYLENQTTDWDHPKFEPHVVDDRHGTIHVPIAHLHDDHTNDFIALISQEHETIVAFINDGKGNFRKDTLYTAPHPAYGSSGIQLVDLNGDGKVDILYTNGDVLDQPYLLKPYHSIQWLENKGFDEHGRLRPFEHHPLTSMYGVHRAVAADLRGDGVMDIVAVAFLPEEGFVQRKDMNLDAVIVLEQTSPGKFDKFERHSLETVTCDHVTCDIGNVFGTGRNDLVIGNFVSSPSDHSIAIWKNLGKKSGER
jgi:hypothetical protein